MLFPGHGAAIWLTGSAGKGGKQITKLQAALHHI